MTTRTSRVVPIVTTRVAVVVAIVVGDLGGARVRSREAEPACRDTTRARGDDRRAAAPRRRAPRPQPIAAADALPALSDLPPERRAIQVVGSGENPVDADAARAPWTGGRRSLGRLGAVGAGRARAIASVFTGLAADRSDGDGQPIAAGERNYLELYGIPPSLSVLAAPVPDRRAGRVRARVRPGRAARGRQIRTWGASTEQKELAKHRAREQRLRAARPDAGADDLQALADGDADARPGREGAPALRGRARSRSRRRRSGSPARA